MIFAVKSSSSDLTDTNLKIIVGSEISDAADNAECTGRYII